MSAIYVISGVFYYILISIANLVNEFTKSVLFTLNNMCHYVD